MLGILCAGTLGARRGEARRGDPQRIVLSIYASVFSKRHRKRFGLVVSSYLRGEEAPQIDAAEVLEYQDPCLGRQIFETRHTEPIWWGRSL